MAEQMSYLLIENRIRHAIASFTTMQVLIKNSHGEEMDIEMDPYIYGADIMQYVFVWGFLPHSRNFYKLELDKIINIKDTLKRFSVEPEAVYLYGIEEEQGAVVKGFNRIFPGGIPPEIKL